MCTASCGTEGAESVRPLGMEHSSAPMAKASDTDHESGGEESQTSPVAAADRDETYWPIRSRWDLGRNVTDRIDCNVTGHDRYVTPVTQEAKQK
jgi:hypothetical protein